ncbi:MAG: YebC/PmpR family DNA-binding transcriptional regulator [Candidatus Pacebacteria bacterium]|nr:YebC/PmpR family DNA-binding transcriptional regulator [Candidatus Paceibacterota bacterium]
MSGHSKWAQIKHQKSITDVKKGKLFSKFSRLISLAAKRGTDPGMNPSLKYAINQAKAANMPADNIEKAIKKGAGSSQEENLEEARYEAFGPGGCSLIIETITDNKNRTFNEIRHLLSQRGVKLGEPGSAAWAFEKESGGAWKAKIPLEIGSAEKESLKKIIDELEDRDDVQKVYTNAKEAETEPEL